jgi:hypothetical protein
MPIARQSSSAVALAAVEYRWLDTSYLLVESSPAGADINTKLAVFGFISASSARPRL